MIGQYIVYEGAWFDRLIVRQIIGETRAYWKVRHPSRLDETKIKKGSVGPSAFVNSESEAKKLANQYSDKFIKARKHFTDRRSDLFRELSGHSKEDF